MVFIVTLIISCLPFIKTSRFFTFFWDTEIYGPIYGLCTGLFDPFTESIDQLVKIHASTYGFPIKYRESSMQSKNGTISEYHLWLQPSYEFDVHVGYHLETN